jgi:diacylglycerol O-acyltransferase / wax synthase
MDKMQHLSAMDSAFLHLETAEMPMHVGSLHRYQLPDGYKGNWYEDVKAHMAKRLHLAPVFRRKLALMPFDLANPVWIEDDDVDLDYHVRHTVLPRPGTQAQLEALAARLHSSLLDRSRPLWEFYVVEGLADGTMGFYSKVHHAAIDGQAGVALGNAMLDTTPVPRAVKSPRQRRHHQYQLGVAELLGAAASNTLRQIRMIGGLLWPLAKTLASSARESWAERRKRTAEERAARKAAGSSLLKLAPPTPFNVSITNQRAFATLSLPLAEAKQLGKAQGASINDLVLWLCSTALRAHLKESRELPEKSLVAGVPVSLRAEGDTRMNNQATMSLIDLGTQIDDPLQRLQAIKAETQSMKNQMGHFSALIPTDFPSLGAPWLLSGLVSLYGRSGLADRIRISNVAISNVPGAPVPLYLAGAKMLDYYPVSIVIHGVALNVTVQSYMGQLCFGLISCRRAVPDVRDIAVQMQRAFDTFRQLPIEGQVPAPVPVRPMIKAKPAAARPAAAKSKRAGAVAPVKAVPAKARPKLRVVAQAAAPERAARRAKAR